MALLSIAKTLNETKSDHNRRPRDATTKPLFIVYYRLPLTLVITIIIIIIHIIRWHHQYNNVDRM